MLIHSQFSINKFDASSHQASLNLENHRCHVCYGQSVDFRFLHAMKNNILKNQISLTELMILRQRTWGPGVQIEMPGFLHKDPLENGYAEQITVAGLLSTAAVVE